MKYALAFNTVGDIKETLKKMEEILKCAEDLLKNTLESNGIPFKELGHGKFEIGGGVPSFIEGFWEREKTEKDIKRKVKMIWAGIELYIEEEYKKMGIRYMCEF